MCPVYSVWLQHLLWRGVGGGVMTGKIIRTSISMCLFPCTALKRYLGLPSGKCHLIHNRWSWHQNPFQTQCITGGFLLRRNNTFQQAFVSLTVEIARSMGPLSTVSPDEFLSTPWKNRLSHRLCVRSSFSPKETTVMGGMTLTCVSRRSQSTLALQGLLAVRKVKFIYCKVKWFFILSNTLSLWMRSDRRKLLLTSFGVSGG